MAQAILDPHGDAAHRRAQEAQSLYAPAEARALGTIALLSVAAILWVAAPVGTGVMLGTVFAFALYPICGSLARRTQKPRLVAATITALTTLALAGTLGMLLFLLVQQGVAVFARLPHSLAPGGSAEGLMARLAAPLRALHIEPATAADRLSGALGQVATYAAGWATQMANTFFDAAIALVFMATTMYFVLRRWSVLGRLAERMMPINPRHTRRLMRQLRRLGHAVILGNFGTALVQGLIGWAGYAIVHLPQAALLGALTAAASLVPVVGTFLVWIPAGLILVATGHPAAGILLFVWGILAVACFCDYVVRPKLVGGNEAMSSWMTLVAIFGGIKLFGFVGVLIGPMLVGLALEALRIYERTRRFRLNLR